MKHLQAGSAIGGTIRPGLQLQGCARGRGVLGDDSSGTPLQLGSGKLPWVWLALHLYHRCLLHNTMKVTAMHRNDKLLQENVAIESIL